MHRIIIVKQKIVNVPTFLKLLFLPTSTYRASNAASDSEYSPGTNSLTPRLTSIAKSVSHLDISPFVKQNPIVNEIAQSTRYPVLASILSPRTMRLMAMTPTKPTLNSSCWNLQKKMQKMEKIREISARNLLQQRVIDQDWRDEQVQIVVDGEEGEDGEEEGEGLSWRRAIVEVSGEPQYRNTGYSVTLMSSSLMSSLVAPSYSILISLAVFMGSSQDTNCIISQHESKPSLAIATTLNELTVSLTQTLLQVATRFSLLPIQDIQRAIPPVLSRQLYWATWVTVTMSCWSKMQYCRAISRESRTIAPLCFSFDMLWCRGNYYLCILKLQDIICGWAQKNGIYQMYSMDYQQGITKTSLLSPSTPLPPSITISSCKSVRACEHRQGGFSPPTLIQFNVRRLRKCIELRTVGFISSFLPPCIMIYSLCLTIRILRRGTGAMPAIVSYSMTIAGWPSLMMYSSPIIQALLSSPPYRQIPSYLISGSSSVMASLSMEDSQSLILRKPTLQFLRHLLYSQLIPIILFIVIIHEVIEQFVILIDAPRDDQELAVDALAVECAAGGLCLGEFESFYFQGFDVDCADCVCDQAEPLLEVVVAPEADYLVVVDHAWVGLAEAFHAWDLGQFFPSVLNCIVDNGRALFSASNEEDLFLNWNSQGIVVDIGFPALQVLLVDFKVHLQADLLYILHLSLELLFYFYFFIHSGWGKFLDPLSHVVPLLLDPQLICRFDLLMSFLIEKDLSLDERFQQGRPRSHIFNLLEYLLCLIFINCLECRESFLHTLLGELNERTYRVYFLFLVVIAPRLFFIFRQHSLQEYFLSLVQLFAILEQLRVCHLVFLESRQTVAPDRFTKSLMHILCNYYKANQQQNKVNHFFPPFLTSLVSFFASMRSKKVSGSFQFGLAYLRIVCYHQSTALTTRFYSATQSISTFTSQFGFVNTDIFLFFYSSFYFYAMGRKVEPGIRPP